MGHVIVCGLGQVGYQITMLLLQLGENVTVISEDARSEFVRDVEKLGGKIILGDARDRAVLTDGQVQTSIALITATDSDLANIEISLDAQLLNPKIRVVARLFDQKLAKRLEKSVGIHRALAMSALSAPNFAAAAIGSDVIGSFTVDGNTYSVHQRGRGEVSIIRSEPRTMSRSHKRKQRMTFRSFIKEIPSSLKWLSAGIVLLSLFSVLVFCSTMRLSIVDATYFVVATLTTTGYGDITVKDANFAVKLYTCLMMVLGSAAVATLYSIITDYFVSSRFAEILGRQQVSDEGHIIMVGLGNVGFRICEALVNLGYSVVVIDADSNAKYRGLLPDSVTFISGDGRDDETLELAGIGSALSIVAATHDDAVNLSTCLVAKGIGPKVKTVVRLFDADFARKVESALDVDTALSAPRISAPGFVGAAIFEESVFSFVTEEDFVAVIPIDDGFTFIRKKLAPTKP